MKQHLSLSQRIKNAAASHAVENVKARHTYLHARADATGEWGAIWSRTDEVTWAHAFGRMRGFDQVWYGSVTQYDVGCMHNFIALYDKYPEVGGKDPRPLSEASVHTLVNDVIEVADDGLSARASFITPGVIHSHLTPMEHKYCHVLWERYGSDFVFEDGAWKYLDEQVCPDIMTSLDNGNWAVTDYERLTAQVAEEAPPPTLGDPPPVTDPGPLHEPYSAVRPPKDTVPWPEPYATMDDIHRYIRGRQE
jgi:hypothetical protein